MSLSIVILIREDPFRTHRPTEALRIALGLSTGPNPLTIILVGQAIHLLTEKSGEAIDADILEKHLPVIQELLLPIIIPEGSRTLFSIDPDFKIQEASLPEITQALLKSDRTLVF